MASIKKRANGTFQAAVYVGRDASGKQLFRYITRPTEKAAKAAARKLEQEIEEGRLADVDRMRLVSWVEEWIKLNEHRLPPQPFDPYRSYVRVHYEPYFGSIKLGKLTELHIRRFMNDKLSTLSPTTVSKLILVLKKALREAMKNGSPARDIEPPPLAHYTVHLLTSAEFDQILKAVSGTEDEPIFLLAAWGGLRRGEIFALKWDDIDWKEGSVRVDETLHITDEGDFVLGPPKSKNGFRTVVVPDHLMQLLREIRRKQSPLGQMIFNRNPNVYSNHWIGIIDRKQLPPVRFHDLRHYHASWLYDNGIPDQHAAKRLGHDIQTLKTIYQHLDKERGREIDDNIRRLQGGHAQQNAQQNITNGLNNI